MLRKIVVIALREYNAAVRTKAFVVSLVFLPVLMLGSFGVQALVRNKVDITAKHFAVIDHTEEGVLPALEVIARKRNEAGLRDPSGKQVRPEYVLERVPPPDSVTWATPGTARGSKPLPSRRTRTVSLP